MLSIMNEPCLKLICFRFQSQYLYADRPLGRPIQSCIVRDRRSPPLRCRSFVESQPSRAHRKLFLTPTMVIFFNSTAHTPDATIFMGKDKFESAHRAFLQLSFSTDVPAAQSKPGLCITLDEDLIKYSLPDDIWFHVDNVPFLFFSASRALLDLRTNLSIHPR